MNVGRDRKLQWFDRGAACVPVFWPGLAGVYKCPICVIDFPREAVATGVLTAEDVPPRSVGGRKLLLTCEGCNGGAGREFDAHLAKRDAIESVMAGHDVTVKDVRAIIDGVAVNGSVGSRDGQRQFKIQHDRNPPGTSDTIRPSLGSGAVIELKFEPYEELGAINSLLRAGYLALVARVGYVIVADPAMEIVQRQIRDYQRGHILVSHTTLPGYAPLSTAQILRVLDQNIGRESWAVKMGRYVLHYPGAGDSKFYNRLASQASRGSVRYQVVEDYGWPSEPSFGL